MQSSKILLILSTTITLLTLQSCKFNNKITTLPEKNSQEKITAINFETTPEISEYFKKSDKLTNTARFLAGMNLKETSQLNSFKEDSNWLEHHRFFAHSWSKLETQQLAQVRQWAKENLTEINTSNPSIFYPFSSGDFLTAYSLFPQAKEYILVDSKPVGTIPELNSLSASEIKDTLQKVKDTFYPLLQSSSLTIKEQKTEVTDRGILPVLFVFLARTNNRILNIEYISLDSEGNIQPREQDLISGVKISFTDREQTESRTVYYFSHDLADLELSDSPELANFISNSKNLITYLNTASYAMYRPNFTKIKNLILAQSDYLLQDDSGIPIDSFSKSNWDLNFYGKYTHPSTLFSRYYQPELRQVYDVNKEIIPLRFEAGYQLGVNQSNLMLAKNKKISSK